MRWRSPLLVPLALASLCAPGCASLSPLGDARPVEPGKVRVFGGYKTTLQPVSDGATPSGTVYGYELGGAVGLAPRLELSGRLSGIPFGYDRLVTGRADLKAQLVRSASPESGFDLSLTGGLWCLGQNAGPRLGVVDVGLMAGENFSSGQLFAFVVSGYALNQPAAAQHTAQGGGVGFQSAGIGQWHARGLASLGVYHVPALCTGAACGTWLAEVGVGLTLGSD